MPKNSSQQNYKRQSILIGQISFIKSYTFFNLASEKFNFFQFKHPYLWKFSQILSIWHRNSATLSNVRTTLSKVPVRNNRNRGESSVLNNIFYSVVYDRLFIFLQIRIQLLLIKPIQVHRIWFVYKFDLEKI